MEDEHDPGLPAGEDLVPAGAAGLALVDVAQRWSERIARRVAPAEADFAANVGAAFAAGGQARKNLLPRPGTQPGAFGPGGYAADLPLILRALADASHALLPLLGSPYVSNALAVGSLLAALRAGRRQAPETAGPAGRPAAGPQPPPSPSERQAVELAFESLRSRLVAAGFSQERAGQLAAGLLEELLTDTADAAQFVNALSAVPAGRTRLRPRRGRKGPGHGREAGHDRAQR